jgi:hypothetical protein
MGTYRTMMKCTGTWRTGTYCPCTIKKTAYKNGIVSQQYAGATKQSCCDFFLFWNSKILVHKFACGWPIANKQLVFILCHRRVSLPHLKSLPIDFVFTLRSCHLTKLFPYVPETFLLLNKISLWIFILSKWWSNLPEEDDQKKSQLNMQVFRPINPSQRNHICHTDARLSMYSKGRNVMGHYPWPYCFRLEMLKTWVPRVDWPLLVFKIRVMLKSTPIFPV